MAPRLKKAFAAKNARRCALIDKQLRGGGLSADETAELAELEEWVGAEVNRVHPLPLDALRKLERLARKLGGGTGRARRKTKGA